MGDSLWSRKRGVDCMGKLYLKNHKSLLKANAGMEKSTSICRISHQLCFCLLALITPVLFFETLS